LGCALERQGATGRSDRAFRRAANAANDPQAPPARVPWRRFVAAVEAAAEALPSALRQALEEVPLELADYTPPYLLEEHPTEIELLGLFEGPTRGDRADLMAIPDTGPRIHVFRRPHEHQCWSVRELTEEVRRTVHHEFGHYLGYGEAELDEFGLG
jgi:predicted Zn-dependent protease with MMP-like domain